MDRAGRIAGDNEARCPRSPRSIGALACRSCRWCFLLPPPCCSLCGDDGETTAAGSTTSRPAARGALSVSVEPPEAPPGNTVEASVLNETEEEFTYGAAYELDAARAMAGSRRSSSPSRR